MNSTRTSPALLDPALIRPALRDAVLKLDPRSLIKNPVIFITAVVSALATVLLLRDAVIGDAALLFQTQLVAWLWVTVLFANFAEALAEGRGKAQAASLRRTQTQAIARRYIATGKPTLENVPATQLRVGDRVRVDAGELIPGDGEIIAGVATVDESAITGESAPVIRESGGDRSAVTGGTRVLSDTIEVRISAAPGSSFIDRMIALVEGAARQKTPNEIALNILLAGMSLIFIFAVATIPSFVAYAGGHISLIVLIALFVTLIPTTIGALLSAIGIAGMNRLVRYNVLAMSGRAVEAAGDVDVLLLDKTGTITLGNRQASELIALNGVSAEELADAAQLASLADETPEGRSVVVLTKEKYGLRGRDMASLEARFVPFTAQTRMSGVDIGGQIIRKRLDRGHHRACRRVINTGATQGSGRPHRPLRRHAAGGGARRPRARCDPPQGYRQGRHPRTLCRVAPHGHQDGDDHRRQRADRGRYRRRGRRG